MPTYSSTNRSSNYLPHVEIGIKYARSTKDGYAVEIEWNRAFPLTLGFGVLYNIYYSTDRNAVFSEGVKFVSTSSTVFTTTIYDLTPGEMYYFSVRAAEYDVDWYNPEFLPDAPDLKLYPESILLTDLTEDSYTAHTDVSQYPNYGIFQIGSELIRYTGKDILNSLLTGLERGFLGTQIRQHDTDGYDGYVYHDNAFLSFFKGLEENNVKAFQEMPSFAYNEYARTNVNGYLTMEKDLLTTDMGATDTEYGGISVTEGGTTDQSLEAMPSYDFAGWHRTDPAAVLRGDCIGSYIGGEYYCADGYDGVGRKLRGIPVNKIAAQREELLLSTTGEPVVLVRRKWTGIRCPCFVSTTQVPDDRCTRCYGTGYVTGYDQFYNPRRSDGRIMVRFESTEDDIKIENGGWESSYSPSCWTLVTPVLKDRDIIIRYNPDDGSEEYRYEILNVNRNKLFLNSYGLQKFKAQRVRKTDVMYQWRAFKNTSTQPTSFATSIATSPSMPPHSHQIIMNEHITSLNQINQTTSVINGHNHTIINGVVQEAAGHTHTIII